MARGLRSLQQLASQYQVLPQIPLLGGTSVDELLGLPGAAREVENWSYGNYPMRINPYAGRTASFIPETKPGRQSDLADAMFLGMDVVPLASLAAKGVGRGALAAGRAGERLAERVVPTIMGRGGVGADVLSGLSQGSRSQVVKPQRGGNWRAGEPERGTDQFRQQPDWLSGEGINEAAGTDLWSQMVKQEGHRDPHGWLLQNRPDIYDKLVGPEGTAINRWLDTKLNKYIKNEMGTPEDPVRALAERGVLHFQPLGIRDVSPIMDTVRQRRQLENMPIEGLGQSPLAQQWERYSDYAIVPRTAREITEEAATGPLGGARERGQMVLEENPWISRLDPETRVYGTSFRAFEEEALGIPHLIDELKNAMAPDSILPANLRLTPDKLNKVTVPQAVELVDKINKWRSAEAAKAEKLGMMDNLKATPRAVDEGFQLSFVEKPGAVWVDIPQTKTKKGMKLCTMIGKQGGWCTQHEEKASWYKSGKSRLVALLDADGRPHVQAEITTKSAWQSDPEMLALEAARKSFTPAQEAAWDRAGILDSAQWLENALEWMKDNAPDAYKIYFQTLLQPKVKPPDITELKPVANSFRSDRAQEYAQRDPNYFRQIENAVLKFLNEGQWDRVADLDHYGIVRIDPDSDLSAGLRAAGVQHPEFVSQRQLSELLDHVLPGDPEGFAQGGLVGLHNKYQSGGLVKTGLVKTFNSLRAMLSREAPEQAAPVREALAETARTGKEHSVIGLAQEGGKSAVSRGTESSVLPNKFDLKAALRDPGRGPILDFHTHPGKGFSFFETAPSRQDFSFYSEQYPQSRELRSLIAVPPERAAGRRTSYNLFVTDKPNTVLDPRALDAARFELQRAGSKGAFRSLVDDPLFREYFEYGGDLGELLEDASSLMLQRYRAQQGAGRHELQLGGKQLTPNFESTDTEMFRRMEGPATEVLRSKKFAEGGAVEFDPDKIDRMAADILSQQPVEVGDKPVIFKSPDELLAQQGRLQAGPLSLGLVRSPRGADARLGLSVAPGLEPFADVDPVRRELTQYGVQYEQPLRDGGINARFAVDPKGNAKTLTGAYRKQIGKDSELSAQGAYVTGAGKPSYNVGVQYKKRFAAGGAVEFDSDKIEAMAAQLSEELYA